MQRRTLGTREALEGILEDAATPTRAFASDYGYDLVSLLLPGDECSYVMGNPPFIGHHVRNVGEFRKKIVIMIFMSISVTAVDIVRMMIV